MINIICCDDQAPILSDMNKFLDQYIKKHDTIICKKLLTADPKQVITYSKLTREHQMNVYLLDIDLKVDTMNGIGLAKKIKHIYDPYAKIIFITTHVHLMSEVLSNNIEPYGFLTKPINKDILCAYLQRLEKAYELIKRDNTIKKSPKVILQTGKRTYTVYLLEVLFIETVRDQEGYLTIYTIKGERIVLKYSLYKLVKEFNEVCDIFCHCYQSYVVNMNYIHSIDWENRIIRVEYERWGENVLFSKKKEVRQQLKNRLGVN